MRESILFKKAQVTFLFLILGLIANSQEYLNESSKWYTLRGDIYDNWYRTSKLEIIGDTIIEGNTYKKIQRTSSLLYLELFSTSDTIIYEPINISLDFLREESKKFYRWWNGEDRLIIDFDLQIGDEIQGPWEIEEIQSIDTMLVGNEYRKIYNTSDGNQVFEGIGTNQGLFEGLRFLGDEGFGALKCYSQDGENYDLYNGWIPELMEIEQCEELFITTNTIDNRADIKFKIYPNPVKEVMWIELEEIESFKILIINLLGQEIRRIQFEQNEKKGVNISDLNKGVYIVQLEIGEKIYSRKIIIN